MTKFNFYLIILVLGITVFSCAPQSKKATMDIQGHRGFRGLYPENTVNGFLKALDVGVTTLELDVVISKDHKVVVSHEPFFNHKISTGPRGEVITKENELTFNLYQMNYEEIAAFDVGLKSHPNFPAQKKVAEQKPLLPEVIKTVEAYAKLKRIKPPNYNIELKRQVKHDTFFHPDGEVFSKLVLDVVLSSGIEDRTSLQAFEISTLQILKELNYEIPLALLVDNNLGIEKNIEKLGFKPDIYSPNYRLITRDEVGYCKAYKIQLIPWTVNKKTAIKKMLDFGVDGIISDYPDRVFSVIQEYSEAR